MDCMNPEQRKKAMISNKSKNTKIEQILSRALWHTGLRFRKNASDVYGTPDICIKKYKMAIFCDGDFWHGKNYNDKEFTSNKKYWDTKIRRNKERDLEVTITLRDQGWTVIRFWEEEIRRDLTKCVSLVFSTYKKKAMH